MRNVVVEISKKTTKCETPDVPGCMHVVDLWSKQEDICVFGYMNKSFMQA